MEREEDERELEGESQLEREREIEKDNKREGDTLRKTTSEMKKERDLELNRSIYRQVSQRTRGGERAQERDGDRERLLKRGIGRERWRQTERIREGRRF